jgi:hypothetical protein
VHWENSATLRVGFSLSPGQVGGSGSSGPARWYAYQGGAPMKFFKFSIVFVALLVCKAALAQSSPGLTYGQVPTAAQWNSYFASKQDALNFTPLNIAGGTMLGKLNIMPARATSAGINLGQGVAPTSPMNGDLYQTSLGVFAEVNGAPVGPFIGAPAIGGPILLESFSPPHGGADATTALNAALNQCSVQGGGTVQIGPYAYWFTSANITVPEHCEVKGGFVGASATKDGGNFLTAPYTFVIAPSFTITPLRNSAVHGVAIVASTLPSVYPTTLQGVATAVQNFSGTAMTIGNSTYDATDVDIRDVFIIGFNQCISQNNADRARGLNVFGDCTNGLSINDSNDTSRWNNTHFWPFYNQANNVSFYISTKTVSNAASLGGLIEITTSTPHGFATGNSIIVSGVGGVPAADIVAPITVVDATHFTLNGSTFSGAYTSGGQAVLDTFQRTGIGEQVTNSAFVVLEGNFVFGYQTGFHFGTGSVWVDCTDCGVDAQINDLNPTSIGYLFDGNAAATDVYGGYISSVQIPIDITSTACGAQIFTGVSIGAGNVGLNGIQVSGGGCLEIIGGSLTTAGVGLGAPIYVADSAQSLVMRGVYNFGQVPITYQSAADAAKVSVIDPFGNLFPQLNISGSLSYQLQINNSTAAALPALLQIRDLHGSQQAITGFFDGSNEKWVVGKQTDDTFFMFDVAHSNDFLKVDLSGNTTLGEDGQMTLPAAGGSVLAGPVVLSALSTAGVVVNATGGALSSDTAGVACSGTPTSSFTTDVHGIVTHC